MKKGAGLLTNQGFTLVELLVALLITGILMAGISSAFLMSQKIYSRSGDISYKTGTVTNTETNLQNLLAVATGVTLESAPKTDNEESYSIGFNPDGLCEEFSTTITVDGSGKQQTVTAVPHLSEIEVKAMNNKTTTLNYKLIPKDETMSTLAGGTVMNNINEINRNQPKEAVASQVDLLKENGEYAELKGSEKDLHYLVLTFKPINSGTVIPGAGINGLLKDKGVIVGNWNKMIAYAKVNYGYLLRPNGAVYTDSSGTYVAGDLQYISESFAKTDPLASTYNTNTGGANSVTFIKISEASRFITAADYETDAYRLDRGFKWKDGQRPRLGDLYIYNNAIYVWQRLSTYEMPQDPETDVNWLKLVSAPEEFQ